MIVVDRSSSRWNPSGGVPFSPGSSTGNHRSIAIETNRRRRTTTTNRCCNFCFFGCPRRTVLGPCLGAGLWNNC